MSTISLAETPVRFVLLLRSLRTARLSAWLSAIGAVCGIGGTALLALNPAAVFPVFGMYLGSSIAWMSVGYLTRQPWLLCSNIIYFALAVKGLAF